MKLEKLSKKDTIQVMVFFAIVVSIALLVNL
jgi:hypothetical protein